MVISQVDGHITVGFNTANIPQLSAAANTIQLMPQINTGGAYVSLATANTNGVAGNIDWSCASATNQTAASTAPAMLFVAGTVLAKYVPTQCK